MMKRISILMIACIILLQGGAQGLTVGDSCPDLPINNILNHTSTSAKVSDYGDKLLILDFMNTSCSSCIKVLPRFDSLQQQYCDQIQILLVTTDKPERVKSFLQKNKIGNKLNLPFVLEDSLLKKHFPHEYISHEVWILKGVVKAITSTEYVKAENIQTLLRGNAINWPIKRDVKDYDYNQPLFTLDQTVIPEFSIPASKYYSSFTSYMDNVPRKSRTVVDSISKTVRVYMINASILEMYLKAFDLQVTFPKSKMIIDVRDPNLLSYKPGALPKQEWKQENTYCYEGIFPQAISSALRKEKIRNDLNFYFNLNGRKEIRQVECLILVKEGEGTKPYKTFINSKAASNENFTSAWSIVHKLNFSFYNKPVFDESGLPDSKYLFIHKESYSDLDKLKKELQQYGLNLIAEKREVEMFVLTQEKISKD